MRLIPAYGIFALASLREAKASDFHDVINLVQGALRDALGLDKENWVQIDAIYPDRVIYVQNGRRWAYSYSISEDNQVTLSDHGEVVKDHKPVKMREAQGAFIEATSQKNRFVIRVIRAGLSGNKVNYPPHVLREAVPLFNGVRVFAKSDEEHIRGRGKDINKLIGKLDNASFQEARGDQPAEIRAELVVLESTGMAARLREALENDMTDLFGFSIDATGVSRAAGAFREAASIKKVLSVDLIVEPGAGGELLSFIEALNNEDDTDMKLRDRMIEAIKKHNPSVLETLDTDDDAAIEAAYREAISHGEGRHGEDHPASTSNGAGAGVSLDDVDERVHMVEARAEARELIGSSKLPAQAKQKLRQDFAARTTRFTEADVTAAIDAERKYLSDVNPGGFVEGLGEEGIQPGQDRSEKVAEMLDNFFDPSKPRGSFKECYIEVTGDTRVTGHMRNCNVQKLREAMPADFREALDSTSFADVLGDSITRAMVRDYNLQSNLDVWRQLADVTRANDFRTQERTRYGGYGDIPAVAESGSYDPLASPSDEKATYAVTKRGGTETVTLEMIKNDDAGAIMRIPRKLSRAAKRTLSKFVLDFLRTNPAIYDTVALFHATHNNLLTAALAGPALAAARLQMMKQVEAGSSEPLGIPPANLWIPSDLEETAVDLFRRNTENDKNFVQSLTLNILPVWYWTDVNDWFLSADKNDIPTIEIAFLDGNEEPELFVQDNPTLGSLFATDEITYKVRHIYGGNVLDFRGLQGNIVA